MGSSAVAPPPPPGFVPETATGGPPPPPPGFVPEQTPESFLGGVWKNLPHPIDAIKSGIEASGDQIGKAKDAIARGDHATAAAHLLGALPILSSVVQGYHGSANALDAADAAKQAGNTPERLTQDVRAIPVVGPPVASAIDQARQGNWKGLMGETAGAGLTLGLGRIAKAVSDAAPSAIPKALESSAQKTMGQVLNATTRGNKARTAAVVPGLLERGVTSVSMKDLAEHSLAGMAAAGNDLEDAYAALPAGSSIPLKAVQDKILADASEQFTVPTNATSKAGVPAGNISMSQVADAGLKHAQDLVERLQGVAEPDPVTGELGIPVATARRLRQYYDSVAAQAGRYDAKALADHSVAEAHGMAADAIRNELADKYPDIAKINKEFSFWKNVDQIVADTMQRRQGQATPLGRQMAGAAGTAVGLATGGIPGAILSRQAMAAVEAAITSPGWRTVSAVAKHKLADAIATGEPGPIIVMARRAAQASVPASAAAEVAKLPAVAQQTPGTEQVAQR